MRIIPQPTHMPPMGDLAIDEDLEEETPGATCERPVVTEPEQKPRTERSEFIKRR